METITIIKHLMLFSRKRELNRKNEEPLKGKRKRENFLCVINDWMKNKERNKKV